MTITLCHIDDIPDGAARGFELDNQAGMFAVRKGDNIFLYRNICPHSGFELQWGPNQFLNRSKSLIACSVHHAQFKIDTGQCIAGPCIGKALETIPFKVIDGQVLIEEEPSPPPKPKAMPKQVNPMFR